MVNVQASTCRCQVSAVPSQRAAEAPSPLRRAMSAAVTRPAISAASVDGEKPPASSQRSSGVAGPRPDRKSADARTFA